MVLTQTTYCLDQFKLDMLRCLPGGEVGDLGDPNDARGVPLGLATGVQTTSPEPSSDQRQPTVRLLGVLLHEFPRQCLRLL